MSHTIQTLIVAALVAAAAAILLWRAFGRRTTKPGCGCNGCPKGANRR